MNTVYKVCLLGKENEVKQIIVFSKEANEEASENLFNEKEQTFIEENDIPVRFSKSVFHKDDSIATIKNKILKEIDFVVSYYELYLFSNIENPYKNLQSIFENISGKDGFIDRNKFEQLIINLGISSNVLNKVDISKTRFLLDDLLAIQDGLTDNSSNYKLSIGKKFRMVHDELFSANPYDILKTTKNTHKSNNPLESFENQLLLNNNGGNFIDNTIFVCFAEDVLEHAEENALDSELIISLYYPLLIKYEVIDKDSLFLKRENLIKKSKKITSKFAFDTYEKVDLFYNVYNEREIELPYISKGVSAFSLTIQPDFKHLLPLDIIFKNIHSTKIIPFIKYNPGFRRENIYRFYSEDITKYGTKIPFLSARTILKLAKETGKKKQISFSIENENGDFYIDIQNNGDINISGNNFKEPIDIESINGVIQSIANPIINHMNEFLRKNGYEMKEFNDIRRNDVEIEYLKYTISLKVDKEINITDYNNCLSPIFEIGTNENDIHKGLSMRFKRVENYNEMDEEDIFIASLYGKNKTDKEMAEMISKKYEITFQAASIKLSKFIRNHEQMVGRTNIIKIADSPGFLVNMGIKSYDDLFICDIEMDNISISIHMGYIDAIVMYIDSLLRISQDSKLKKSILRLCDKTESKPIEKFDNIVTGIEAVAVSDILFSDVYEELELSEAEGEGESQINELDHDGNVESTAFGDLKQYESADITDDIEDIKEYENAEDFELLSPIQDESLSPIQAESLSPIQDESLSPIQAESLSPIQDESLSPIQAESLSPIQDESLSPIQDESLSPIQDSTSKSSSANSLMMAPEEYSSNTSRKTSKSSSANSLMMAPEEEDSSNTSRKTSKSSSANSLMMAPEEDSSKTSRKTSKSSSANSLMMAPEEEDSSNSKSIEKGGSQEDKIKEKQLDGMLLKDSNNNIFLSKLKKKEPTLFLSEDDGKFSAYSTLCQASRQRQPVILSQEEKNKIDENDKASNSKSYNHALEYGSDPNKKNWYICPRFWCLKTNTSISEADVKAGKCGKVIPKGEKTVKKGHYVYEFNHNIQHHGPDGSYKENTPGFLEGSLHPKGLCLPCCFKKEWDSKGQVDRRNECLKQPDEYTKKEKRPKNAKQEEYVYEIRRYPIPQKRWGFLPMAVQLFLQTDNSLSVNPDNNKYLKNDQSTTTLLRYGVENSANKSFIACMADLYAYKKRIATVPSIEEMCNIIAQAVTIDLFVNYHNGSLLSIFKPKIYDVDKIDPTKYEESAFIKKLDMSNETHIEFINEAIAAYENFIEFLKNKESYIDHTYLWDIVCSPNPNLFQTGCNLAILKIREVDITDDIELLCPTSVYSSVLYDIRKETVVLLKHDNYYEPIYLFMYNIETLQQNVFNKKNQKTTNENVVVKKELVIKKTFLEDKSVDNIKEVLQIIRNSIKKFCAPQSSMPRIYKFKRPLPAETLYLILLKYAFEIKNQVLNYQGKTIGFWIRAKDDGIFIPCYPSSQMPDIPVLFMDDDTLWNDYITTRDRLRKIHSISKGEILCRPKVKIMEDGLIVGILTETNQFIMLSNPTENIEPDGIPVINDENYIIADKVFAQTKQQDEVRVNTIKMISLETQFYSAFRTTIRGLLNQMKNKQYKQQITEIIENPRYLYKSKLNTVERIIRKISRDTILFQQFDEATLLALDEITDCFSNPTDKKYCVLRTSGEYQIILPEKHLISGLNNNLIYFSRIADELIRYKRIQLFMMDTKMYLNITNTEYKINEDEMIMLESLLTSDYFKSIEPYEHGKTTKITYETANPIITQKYSNEVSLDEQQKIVISDNTKEEIQDKFGIECIRRTIPIIGKTISEWKAFFPKNATETELHSSVKCSYYPIIYIYNIVYNVQMTVEQVKSKLAIEYEKYMSKYQTKILGILRKQGKRDMVDDILRDKYTLQTAIASEVYFLTNLDYWILSTQFSLPIILFHQKRLKNLANTTNWLKLSDPPTDKAREYFFIRVSTEPDSPGNYLPQYNVIKPTLKSSSSEITQLFANGTPESIMSLETYFDKIEL